MSSHGSDGEEEIQGENPEMEVTEEEKKEVEIPKKEELTEEEKQWRKEARKRLDYNEMIQFGLDEPVVFQLIKMFESGWIKYEEMDEKLKTGLGALTPRQGVQYLKIMWQRDLTYAASKCAYLLGQMRVFNYYVKRKETIFNGPDPKKIEELLQMTGYSLEVCTGQRLYGGPPPGWEGPPPAHREISVSKVPQDWYEDTLVPLFSQYGKIYELRIMIDNITGWTRNFCFVQYCNEEENEKALRRIDGYNFDPENERKTLTANFSSCNKRLFVGNIAKDKSKDEIDSTLSQFVPEIDNVEVFVSEEMESKGQKNRGFCFVEFVNHKAAALGKKILAGLGPKIFNGNMLRVEWYEQQTPKSDRELEKSKTIHVGNICMDVKDDLLMKTFEHYGKVSKIEKVRDYAFIHMEERQCALQAIESLNGAELSGFKIKCAISQAGGLVRKMKKKAETRRLKGERKIKQRPPEPKSKSSYGDRSGYGDRSAYGRRDGYRSYGGGGGYGNRNYGGGGGYGRDRNYGGGDRKYGRDRNYGGGYGGKRQGGGGYGGNKNSGFSGGYYGYGGGGGGYGGKRKRDEGYGGSGGKYQKRY